jgi:hypothetical protein
MFSEQEQASHTRGILASTLSVYPDYKGEKTNTQKGHTEIILSPVMSLFDYIEDISL